MLLGRSILLFTALHVTIGGKADETRGSRSVLRKLYQSMGRMEEEINRRRSRNADSQSDFAKQSDAPSSAFLERGVQRGRKLSRNEKRNHAMAVDPDDAYINLCQRMNVKPYEIKRTFHLRITPSIVTRHKLYCKNGYFLAVSRNGKVNGTLNSLNDEITDLEFLSVGRQLVLIRSSASNKYISMNENSRVVAITRPTIEAIFLYESYKETSFITFRSLFYRTEDWYLALKRSGHVKPGKSTAARQSSAQFLLI